MFGAKLNENALLSAWERMCKDGTVPRWDTPTGFSEYMLRVRLNEGEARRVDDAINFGLLARRGAYQRVFRRYMNAVAPKHVWAARGLHSLCITSADEALSLVTSLWKQEVSFSCNGAYAVAHFGTPQGGKNRQEMLADELMEGGHFRRVPNLPTWLRVVDRWLAEHGLRPTKTNIGRAAEATQCSMVLAGRIPTTQVQSFGGDSESGPMEEAEIKVNPGLPLSSLDGVFVCAPWKVRGGKLATEAERRLFSLSKYTRISFDFYRDGHLVEEGDTELHADVPPRSTAIVRARAVSSVAEAQTRPATRGNLAWRPQANADDYRWYRIV